MQCNALQCSSRREEEENKAYEYEQKDAQWLQQQRQQTLFRPSRYSRDFHSYKRICDKRSSLTRRRRRRRRRRNPNNEFLFFLSSGVPIKAITRSEALSRKITTPKKTQKTLNLLSEGKKKAKNPNTPPLQTQLLQKPNNGCQPQ